MFFFSFFIEARSLLTQTPDGKIYRSPRSMFIFAEICPPLSSTSVDISCSYQGETVSCSERVLPGTRASLSCKSSYKLPLTNDPAYREITCLDDGLWDRRVFRCLPGERYLSFFMLPAWGEDGEDSTNWTVPMYTRESSYYLHLSIHYRSLTSHNFDTPPDSSIFLWKMSERVFFAI